MDRATFKKLAAVRLDDAQALLKSRKYAGAYYLAGYSVECGLKACIAKSTRRFEFPDKSRVNRSYTHDLESLLGTAGLTGAFNLASNANQNLLTNWAIIKDWTEDARYRSHSRQAAMDILDAIRDSQDGILPWLAQYW